MTQETDLSGHLPLSDGLVVALIDLIGRDSFAEDLADLLVSGFGHRHFHIFAYRKKLAPVLLASRPTPVSYERGLRNYLSYTYVINPAFRAFQSDQAAGVYLISDFIQGDDKTLLGDHDVDVHIEDSEPIGYRTPGWPKNMAEVIVLINLPSGTTLDFSFLTPLGSRETRDCRQSLDRLFPVLNSVVHRHYALNPASLESGGTDPGQEDRFHDFGGDTLTTREREVAQLILIGHSSTSIALNLNISLSTVKTHRRNIYGKLQISSQAELFSLFLLHLK